MAKMKPIASVSESVSGANDSRDTSNCDPRQASSPPSEIQEELGRGERARILPLALSLTPDAQVPSCWTRSACHECLAAPSLATPLTIVSPLSSPRQSRWSKAAINQLSSPLRMARQRSKSSDKSDGLLPDLTVTLMGGDSPSSPGSTSHLDSPEQADEAKRKLGLRSLLSAPESAGTHITRTFSASDIGQRIEQPKLLGSSDNLRRPSGQSGYRFSFWDSLAMSSSVRQLNSCLHLGHKFAQSPVSLSSSVATDSLGPSSSHLEAGNEADNRLILSKGFKQVISSPPACPSSLRTSRQVQPSSSTRSKW